MNLGNLRTLARASIPGAKISVVNNTILDLTLNQGAADIAAYTLCLKTNQQFNITDGSHEYNLSIEVDDYIGVDKPGLWWYNGSKWREVYPKTLKWFDQNRPNWRNLAEGDPIYYSLDSNIITLTPTPDTTQSNGLWLYYGAKSVDMTSNTHYPFSGSTVEMTHLSIFDYAIIAFAKWKILPMLSKEVDAAALYKEYITEREGKMVQLRKRPDIANSYDMGMRGPAVRA